MKAITNLPVGTVLYTPDYGTGTVQKIDENDKFLHYFVIFGEGEDRTFIWLSERRASKMRKVYIPKY